MEGAAPLVESGADALIAFKCCIENNRRADFTEWGPHRAAVWPTRLQPLGSALLHKATSGGGVEGIAELLVRHVKPVEHVDSRGRPGPLSAKVGCAVTGQQQIARENERNRPHVASCTFVAMDPISGDSTRHAVDNLAEPDRAAEDRRPAMMSSRAARYTKTAFPDAGKAVDFKAAAAGYPSTNVGEGAAACQAAMRCSSAGASNCSSSVEPDRAVIELLPPVTA